MGKEKIKAINGMVNGEPVIVPLSAILYLRPNGVDYDVILNSQYPDSNNMIFEKCLRNDEVKDNYEIINPNPY